jgi:ComF family protein
MQIAHRSSAENALHQVWQAVLDLVFPPRCAVCRQPGTWLCTRCLADLPRLPSPVCQVCGRPVLTSRLCHICRQAPLSIQGIRSVLLFEAGARQAIHQFKYRNCRPLATPMAQLMADYWGMHPFPADVMVPVPLHIAREHERGYNQADLLTRALAATIGLPVLAGVLERARPTRAQVELSAAERRMNMQGAFACVVPEDRTAPLTGGRAGHFSSVHNQRVLLIDDVCTTGATLEACSLALKTAGAASVWGFTLARTA